MHFNIIAIPESERDNLKTAEFFNANGVYAYLFFTPYCERYVTEVYFVDGDNGDCYGQFKTMSDALLKARKMASMTKEERRQYDE